MSSHSYHQNRTDEETRNTIDFFTIFMLFILALTLFAFGYFVRAAQDAAFVSEALSR